MAVAATAAVLVPPAAAGPAHATRAYVVLQMNLCNSGLAVHSCYSFGRAVDEAVAKIHRYPPDLVTLQEICHDDLYARHGWGRLARAMADLYGDANVSVAFAPAWNRDTHDWYRCVDGALYGIALLYHGRSRDVHVGWYTSQDPSEEVRAWVCATAVPGRLTACTTHLSTDPDVAIRQCRALMSTVESRWAQPAVLVAADLNLRAAPGTRDDVAGCVPPGYGRRDDGTLQHVLFGPGIGWVQGRPERMRWTDHPLLYERFQL